MALGITGWLDFFFVTARSLPLGLGMKLLEWLCCLSELMLSRLEFLLT